MSELKGKNIEEVIAAGNENLASVPSGGAVAVSAGAGVLTMLLLLKKNKKLRKKSQMMT